MGVDIGCGMLTVALGKTEIDLKLLDEIIHEYIPAGREIHKGRQMKFPKLQEMNCYRQLKDTRSMERSLGSLGGGNHFIEVDKDDEDNLYLVIHTGSRKLGKQVAEYYQKLACSLHRGYGELLAEQNRLIEEYKAAGRRTEIQAAIKELHRNYHYAEMDIPEDFAYLYGEYSQQYLHDMRICQEFSTENRNLIAKIILDRYNEAVDEDAKLQPVSQFTTIHNYIDHDSNIIRKGAVSAKEGEKLLIPINMRDGSLLCVGKGNPDWNMSAPHGAGRLFSRKDAFSRFTVEEFKKTMDEAGVYTTSVDRSTLDECPMTYKGMDEIVANIGPTADILKVIKPIFNFKATSPIRSEEPESSDDGGEPGDEKRWNIQKIIICDDARTFDINNYGKMLEEGRVICEFSPNKSDVDEEE